MLLNKMNVLDKGFVALIDTSGNGKTLQSLQDEYFKTKTNTKLLDISSATFIIKCPLFVQLNLSQFGFSIISTPSDDAEAYIPDVGEIQGENLADRQRMHQYIKQTTEALLLNQKGMPMDGADELTAQLLTPITVYNELIVHGSLRQWLNFLNQKKMPSALSTYQTQLLSILKTEWKNMETLMQIMK